MLGIYTYIYVMDAVVNCRLVLTCNKHFFHCINTGYDDDILDIGKRKRF